jgi:two-component system LytT family sensor kinase
MTDITHDIKSASGIIEVNSDKKRHGGENIARISRNRAYWISQASGWTFYGAVNLIAMYSFESFNWQKALLFVFICLMGVLSTHYLRLIIKKRGWPELQLKKIIPRVLLSSLLIGIILSALFFSINLTGYFYDITKFKPATPLIWIFNLSSVIFLWQLIYFSVHYFQNYKKVEIEALIWEAAVKDFELKTLKSQLNPHFMFNALNSIRALIEEEPASAKTAVTKLSNILRYSLRIEKSETVTLEDEMQTVADYLDLEKMRFEERLNYTIKTDSKAAKTEIPPMMVQTLVENGIKHGISRRTNGGKISVNSFIEDSKLHIQISNTGQLSDEDLKQATGFGIQNTKHRLNLLYGINGSFNIHNTSKSEVLAEVIIPTGGKINESFNSR